MDGDGSDGKTVKVLLVCPERHCWEEQLALDTMHSSLFVERRRDLEVGAGDRAPHRAPPSP